MAAFPPRDRIVYATAQGLRRRGVDGSGLRDLVAAAGAPWGSLRHYFPDGKDQIVAEAVVWSGDLAGSRVRRYLEETRTPTARGLFEDLVDTWIDDLERHDFERGCPVVGAVADGPPRGGVVQQACLSALEAWRGPIVDGLRATGVPAVRARDLATTMLACVEGAILMARLTRSAEPLRAARRTLGEVLESASEGR
jgi:AcrR family transcriptional regulator